jgi:hypothetical protein
MPAVDAPRGGSKYARPAPVVVQAPTLPPIIRAPAPAPTRQQTAAAAYHAAPQPSRPVYVPPAPRTAALPPILPPPPPTPRGDAAWAGPSAGAVDRYKQSTAYKQAVLDVFLRQSPYQQQAVVAGALKNPASPEGGIVLDWLQSQYTPADARPHGPGLLPMRTPGVPRAASEYLNPKAPAPSWTKGAPLAAVTAPRANVSLSGFEKLLANAGMDVATMPGGTLQALWALGTEGAKALGAVTQGKVGEALHHELNIGHQVADPFVQAVEHPWQTFQAHPVNTLLLFSGLKSLIGKSAGAAMRSGALGETAERWGSTTRTPLSLGTIHGEPAPAPLVNERVYSKDIFNKVAQAGREQYIDRVLKQNPNVARPAPEWFPQIAQDMLNERHLRRIGNEMPSVAQALQRSERNRVLHEMHQADPGKIPREAVTTLLQGITARTPETVRVQLEERVARLKEANDGTRTQANKWNKRQVRDIERVLKTPGALEKAIAAAEQIRPVGNAGDEMLAQQAILTPDQIEAKYFPAMLDHMGARYDKDLKRLVNDQYPDGIPTDVIQRYLQGWRDVPNEARVQASRVLENTEQVLRQRQAEHNDAAAEYRAAVEHHRNTTAVSQGQPTALELQKLSMLRALRDRPGTPGEGAAAQAAIDRIEAKIRERSGGAGPDPAVLEAAQQRLNAANLTRAQTRSHLQAAQQSMWRAREEHATLPETVSRKTAEEIPDPMFVGHYEDKATPGQFYSRYHLSRGNLSQGRRTGAAWLSGGYDHTYGGLAGQMAARAQALVKAAIHDRLVRNSFIKPADYLRKDIAKVWAKARADMEGASVTERARIERKARAQAEELRSGMFTHSEAKQYMEAQPRDDYGNLVPGEIELTPIRAAPANAIDWVQEQGLQDPMQLQSINDLELRAVRRAVAEGANDTNQARNIVLAPKILVDQLLKQYEPRGRLERGVGPWMQKFRNTVLPYSTHWMWQIGTEAALRAALAGIFNPNLIADGKRLQERLMESEAGKWANAEMTGSTFYGQRGTMGIYSPPSGLQRIGPVRGIVAAHKWYSEKIGEMMYGFEHTARMAGLGKIARDHAREIREFGHGWQGAIKIEGEVLEQIAQGLEANPALVARFGRKIDQLFGQYGKYSPMTRSIIQSIAPFLPWYLTATKYVFWQLPAHHPIASSLLASLRQTVQQDIKDGKQQPLNPYAAQAFGTLSPFGIFVPEADDVKSFAKEAAQKAMSLPLPNVSGAALAAFGLNPFGEALKGPGGTVRAFSLPALAQAGNAFAEAHVPLLRQGRNVLEGGRPSYGTSNILSPQPKPGGPEPTVQQILDRVLDPTYSLKRALKYKQSTGGTSSYGGGGLSTYGPGGGYGISSYGPR